MQRLKHVRNRRTDPLTQVRWDQLEGLLAVYYQGQGYRVDHVVTGGTGARFDGGIDLKLYKDDAYLVVQCKHWNAMQVTHNAVHELLGIMITQGATGAILVTSGEFSRAASEAATKQGHVQLVDGDDLRELLGPLPEVLPSVSTGSRDEASVAGDIASRVGERLLGAAEDRIRGPSKRQPTRGVLGHAMDAGLGIVLLKLVIGLVIVLSLTGGLKAVLRPIQRLFNGGNASEESREVTRTEASRATALRTRSSAPEEVPQSARITGKAARILERSET